MSEALRKLALEVSGGDEAAAEALLADADERLRLEERLRAASAARRVEAWRALRPRARWALVPVVAAFVVGLTFGGGLSLLRIEPPAGRVTARPVKDGPPNVEPWKRKSTHHMPVDYVGPGEADVDPVVVEEHQIPYPEEAKRDGIEGTVRLRVMVDMEGSVAGVQVLSGPGHGLDEAAREALMRFRFKPAIVNSAPTMTTITYEYKFILD